MITNENFVIGLELLLFCEICFAAHRNRINRINMRIIVQTHFKVFFDNRELEFDGLKPLAVGLLAFARKTIAGSTEIAN